jgi:stress response protein YsnF
MADERTSGIYPLHELDDLQIAANDVDPRGWAVFSEDGQRLGAVTDLLVDTAAMKVRYLEVALDGRAAAGAEDDSRRVLFPVGTARLDGADDRVFVNVDSASVDGLPAYTRGGAVSRDYEDSVRRGFVTAAGTTAGTAAAPGEITAAELDYYNHDHYDTGRFYGTRGQGADAPRDDAAGLDSARTDSPRAGSAVERPMGAGEEVRVPVHAEEAVISKRTVVREVLVIKKRMVPYTQTIETDLRTERVEVERTGQLADAGAQRGTGARVAGAVDDLKDRVDGNPASRPGPDATDRRP